MNRIKELQDFIAEQNTAISKFDEADVRKLIQKITVYEDRFTVEFKSGISVDITESKIALSIDNRNGCFYLFN